MDGFIVAYCQSLHFLFLLFPVSLVQVVHHFFENDFSYWSLCHGALLDLVFSFLLLPCFITSSEVWSEEGFFIHRDLLHNRYIHKVRKRPTAKMTPTIHKTGEKESPVFTALLVFFDVSVLVVSVLKLLFLRIFIVESFVAVVVVLFWVSGCSVVF